MRSVLFVDDEPSIVTLAHLALKRRYRVVTATSGAAALALLAREPIDALVTDYRMGDMTGLELIRQCRASRPELPCLLSTGYATEAAMLEAEHALEAAGILGKPWTPAQLRAAIEALFQ